MFCFEYWLEKLTHYIVYIYLAAGHNTLAPAIINELKKVIIIIVLDIFVYVFCINETNIFFFSFFKNKQLQRNADDILMIVGGVVPEADYPFLKKSGVAQVYGPGTRIPDAARELVEMLMKKIKK